MYSTPSQDEEEEHRQKIAQRCSLLGSDKRVKKTIASEELMMTVSGGRATTSTEFQLIVNLKQ